MSASRCISWLSCVCKSLNFFLRTLRADWTMFSGFKEPADSTFMKNFLGTPWKSKAASSNKNNVTFSVHYSVLKLTMVTHIFPLANLKIHFCAWKKKKEKSWQWTRWGAWVLNACPPFFRFWVYCVSEGIVRIVFVSHSSGRIPLGMLLPKSLPCDCFQLQLLTFAEFDDEDFCERNKVLKINSSN